MQVDEAEVPLCVVCGHNHVQGVKCHICGHVGRSQIYQKMKLRANEKRVTKTIMYDGSAFTECLDDWDVIMELRKKCYCCDNLIPIDVEFDEGLEKSSRHVICFVGDAPIAVARYRITTAAEGIHLTDIDRLGILPQYRGQKYTRKILVDILQDSQQYTNSSIAAILLSIPVDSWIQGKLEHLGWKVYSDRPVESRGMSSFFPMICQKSNDLYGS